ncbi:MAG TPA: sialidase family protein [Thermoplasmata archaeon]|nr:sialidase family protein [Thermoplasmata archaeon]
MLLVLAGLSSAAASPTASSQPTFNINTLAGKMASIDATQGLSIRASAYLQQEADAGLAAPPPGPAQPITPHFVLSSPLDGTSVAPPAVTVNQDTAAAPQNEPAVAVDPSNPQRVVVGMNDYVSRTWSCKVGSTPCSALGDGYSGTYYSNDGGATWCCTPTDPSHLGTEIPGVERLTGGIYDAGGDPSLAFNSQGVVYYAGLGFDRTAPPNTVAVNVGTFDGSGALSWSQPTFINPLTSRSILNDKPWIGVDSHVGSPFQDHVYVSWTRFVFNPVNGVYKQSPIAFVHSSDGGATFSSPQLIVGNVLYDQGSHIVVGPDGTVYVFWEGSTRLAALNSIWVVSSSDGGLTWSKPVAISTEAGNPGPANTVFRVNSFPAADISTDGTLVAAWASEVPNDGSTYAGVPGCAYFLVGTGAVRAACHATVIVSMSTDGGMTWSAPAPAFPALDSGTRTTFGYPVTNPDGSVLSAPAHPGRIDMVFPAVAAGPAGQVYVSAYADDLVSPWQTCASGPAPPVGRITCDVLGPYVHNGRLDYVVTNLTSGAVVTANTAPINTRYGFGGGFFGDYTDLAVGSDGTFHAVWTDSNNVQSVTWFYGFEFVPTPIHQEDIVTGSGSGF